jgi:hypothetical protein
MVVGVKRSRKGQRDGCECGFGWWVGISCEGMNASVA